MKKRLLSLLLALCMLAGLFPALPVLAADAPDTLYLEPSAASNIPSRIDLYPDPSGAANQYHMYLPGNAAAGSCFLSWEGGASATLNGRSYASGTLPIPAPGQTEAVTVSGKTFNIRTYQGSAAVHPIFVEIDESQGTIAAMNADPNHETICVGEIVIDGQRMALPQMKGRGNATWRDDKEKKPYNIKLDKKITLPWIDCAKTKKWSLLSNVNDRTLLRNKVAYDLAHQMGIGFDSATVDLWMNGVYWGTYLLTPKTDSYVSDDGYLIEDNNISDSETPHIDGTGMILNIKDIGDNLILAEGGDPDNPDSRSTQAAASKISSYFKEAWSAVTASSGTNSQGKHYSEYFDADSMASFYLLHEFIKNLEVDGGSIFLHRDGTADSNKLIAGPAWDYDNSMGYNGSNGSMASGGSGWPRTPLNYASLSVGNWYITGRNRGKLFGTFSKHQDFLDLTHEVYNRYYTLFDDVSANVRRQAAQIADSAEMNFVRTVKEDKNNFDFPQGNTRFDEGTEYEVNYKEAQVWSEYVDNLVTFTSGRARFFHDQMYVENTCDHEYDSVTFLPTCTMPGYTSHTCRKCGDSYIDDEKPALGHNFVEGVCTNCGEHLLQATFVCDEGVSVTVYKTQSTDSEAYENAVTAFPRNSTTGEIDVSGDGQINFVVNVADGYRLVDVTARGGYKNIKGPDDTAIENGYRITKITGNLTVTVTAEKAEIGPHDHNYVAVVTPPTCTEKGYTTYTCSICGDSYTDDEVDELIHIWPKEGVVTKEATATERGELTFACERCGAIRTRPIASGAEKAHKNELLFISDLHSGLHAEEGYHNLRAMFRLLRENDDFVPEVVCGGGDYLETRVYDDADWPRSIQALQDIMYNESPDTAQALIVGNHEWEWSRMSDEMIELLFGNPRTGSFYSSDDFAIFQIGAHTNSGNKEHFRSRDLTALRSFLESQVGNGKVIFIQTHWPLHYGYNSDEWRTTDNADDMIDLLNEFADRMDIVFVWGHNHNEDEFRHECRTRGDDLQIARSKTMQIQFTYINAGCLNEKHAAEGAGPEGSQYGPGYLLEARIAGDKLILDYGHITGAYPDPAQAKYDHNADLLYVEEIQQAKESHHEIQLLHHGVCAHEYTAAVTAPTCTEAGYTTYTCSKCGDSYVADETAALGHDWDAGVVTVPATETSTGIRTYTCARCGEKRTEAIPVLVHVHDYKAVVTAPTCTEKGYTTYTCAGCGDSYVGDEVAALGHGFGSWSVSKAASCTEKGEEARTCARCGEKESRELAALGHDYKAVVTAPTCTTAGFTTHTCSRCGSSYTDGATAALGHAWDAGVITKQPTETSTGIRTYTCTRCGETRTEVIPELTHVHSYTAVVTAPTCTEGGYTTHTCACGDSYRDGYTDALGHSFGAWSVSKAAACTEPGEEARTCARCGEKETREVEALGHDYKAAVTAPTCTEGGYTTYTCARCSDSYRADETAALGHDFGEWAVSKAATCTAEGEETRSCTRCDEKQTRAIEKAAHEFKDGKCTVCGETDPNYVNYDALDGAIEAAEQLDLSKYTDETVAAFNKALEAAKTALAADQQAAVDKAKADLEAAIDGLVEKSDPFRFDDVRDESMYYFTPVYWAYEHDPQITTGTSANLFSPDRGCTRAQAVTFLWRAKGEPEPERTSNPFADVRTGAYYYKAVLWAVEKGVTTGTSATTFRPDQTCTRAQIVTFLWRAEGQPEPESSKNPFADVKSGEYYTKAVLWAVENNITKGTAADKFSPNATCTRAQIVTFLHRAMEK